MTDASATLSPRMWRASRLALDFLLDIIQMSRMGGDVLDPLLLGNILAANLGAVNQDSELQLTYAAMETPLPDELRRPVSVNAVAQSTGLPYETVRRRIGRLAKAGRCLVTPRRVIVPLSVLSQPEFITLGLARYARLKRFYFDLQANDALPALTHTEPREQPPCDAAPVRIGNRVLIQYVMRVLEIAMRRVGDPLTVLIQMDLARANTEHLSLATQQAEIPVPDRLRRPISVSALARRLGVPAENVRRRTTDLENDGACRRVKGGFISLGAAFTAPDAIGGLFDNASNLQRMFTRLDRLGVLAAWDREGPALSAAVG